jgi:D-alanyl-D-alanine carboxypeptidase
VKLNGISHLWRTGLAMAAAALVAAQPAFAGPSIVIDAKSGLVLYSEEAERPWHPASLTKLMTAYLAFEDIRDGKLSLEDKVVSSPQAVIQPPSKIGLPVGAEMRVETALKALIVKSANDVAVMLAEKMAGSEEAFVARMNATAKRLGMTGTTFKNANGLPHPDQVTTAKDMAILGRVLVKEFPDYGELFALPSFRLGKRFLRSHNELLNSFEGADGMKTGFICSSGYNIVTSATRNGRQLIAVVLGATSGSMRKERAASLMEYGFEIYGWKSMFSASLNAYSFEKAAWSGPTDISGSTCYRRRKAGALKKKAIKAKMAKETSKANKPKP